jgi:tetratricopeptide (TPR) repeat protein
MPDLGVYDWACIASRQTAAPVRASMPSEQDFEYDVFISYSSQDKDWVRGELLPGLEAADVKAFIDSVDFEPGEWAVKEMTRAVSESRKMLAVLTPSYLESKWCEQERLVLQTLSPANQDHRMLPILRLECDPPAEVKGIVAIDFTDDADPELAWRKLLTALGKPPEPTPPETPRRDGWFLAHPYGMPPNFTGRIPECQMLTAWLERDAAHPLLSLTALGGFGKSALAWHWIMNDVTPAAWPKVVWWSFYEADASFESFLAKTLHYLSSGRIRPKELSPRGAVETLLAMLHQPGTLLVLDGFERVLRAFGGLDAAYQGDDGQAEANDHDCISPLAELFLYNVALLPELRSKTLLTTRLRPRVLEAKGGQLLHGCREEELMQMHPADAVAFFGIQGIRGTHTEIEEACEPYGYHPLSLCLLAGLIVDDFEQPGDIAAAKGLDVSGDLIQRKHHVLERAYDSLTPARQDLLGRIACYRSPVTYEMLKALADPDDESAEHLKTDLRKLVARGLLHYDVKQARFDLHPIVRRYAYDRLASADRTTAHTRLRDYFAAVPEVEKVTSLEDLAPVIELYHHTVRAGQLDEAFELYRDRLDPLYYQLGAYQLIIHLMRSLFPDGEDRAPRLKDEGDQGWTLNELANSYSRSGQPRLAVPLHEQHNAICEKRDDKRDRGIGLSNIAGLAQLHIGEFRAAETNLRRSIALCGEIEDEFWGAVGRQHLGRLLAYRGRFAESETELVAAWAIFEEQGEVQSQGIVWAYRAQRELLLLRSNSDSASDTLQRALDSAGRALELADETASTHYPHERDYVRAHWLLGAAHRVAGQHDRAESHLHEALERCRRINMVDHEADILIDSARLRAATGGADEARRLAEEALVITERSGYVLQGADAHLELGKLAQASGDEDAAREHAREAKELATCDGPPDYTYKAAYDEAVGLLAELG